VTTHLMIPDCQVKVGTPNCHIHALARLITEHRPDVIVNIGDFWDMESLSSYASLQEQENRRYQEDIDAGNRAMDILNNAIAKIPKYNPQLVFTIGNHEHRIQRAIEKNPIELDGVIGYDDFSLDMWTVYDFQDIAEIDGVAYTHFIANPMSGKPIGGSIDNRLKQAGFSFSTGHQQTYQYGIKSLNNGATIHGLVAGSFYLHDEGYKGPQGNNHWRGVIWKNNVKDGEYDISPMRMTSLLERYGK